MGVAYGSTTITNVSGGLDILYAHTAMDQDSVAAMCERSTCSVVVETIPSDLYVGDPLIIYFYTPGSTIISSAISGVCLSSSGTTVNVNSPKFIKLSGADGSHIWTSTAAPTTPNYTFAINKLTGDSDVPIKVGDIIFYGTYRYTVNTVSSSTVRTINRQSLKGDNGVLYYLELSHAAVSYGLGNVFNPETIEISGKVKEGDASPIPYAARFTVDVYDNNQWYRNYESPQDETGCSYTFTKNYPVVLIDGEEEVLMDQDTEVLITRAVAQGLYAYRISMYAPGGTDVLLDQQTIPVVQDGVNTYNIILSNENHTFISGKAGSTTCDVIGFFGISRIATTIGTINTPTGMTVTVSNNGTANTSFTVAVTDSFAVSNGTIDIPITVANTDTVFRMKFTYSLTTWGLNNATITLYQRSASAPSAVSSSLTYTFSTANISGALGNWLTAVPTGTDDLWVTMATATSNDATDVISASEWSTPTKMTANGLNQATIFLYKRSAATPGAPSGTSTYNFKTGILSNTPSGWSRSVPDSNGNPCWVCTAAAYSNADTYTIASSAWSAPTRLAVDGDVYEIELTNDTVTVKDDSSLSPTSITISSSKTSGDLKSTYAGRFTIDSCTKSGSVTRLYTSSANESSKAYTLPASIKDTDYLMVTLYEAGGVTNILTWRTINVSRDGSGYTVYLTNDNHTFVADTSAALASTIECNVLAYRGNKQLAPTIGSITGYPTGMTIAIQNNGTTSAKLRISVTSSMTTKNGVVTVPITVDGISFERKFTYSLAIKGDSVIIKSVTKTGDTTTIVLKDGSSEKTLTIKDGEDGDDGIPGTNGANGYVHIAWANSANGSAGFSTSDSVGKLYLGTYTDNTKADSTDPTKYKWALIRGATWFAGTGITGTSTTPAVYTNSGVAYAAVNDRYLNTSTQNVYVCTVEGTASTAKWKFYSNIKGTSVASIETQYYLSNTSEGVSGGSWGSAPGTYVDGYYYFTRNKITFTDGSATVYTDPVYDRGFTDTSRNALTAYLTADRSVGIINGYSTFATATSGTANAGYLYVHGFTNSAPADVNGYVMWNGVKRTVSKGYCNGGSSIIPANTVVYIILRLSSVNATSGTNYMVWYNRSISSPKWEAAKFGVASPSTMSWGWNNSQNTTLDIDVVIGQFTKVNNAQNVYDAYIYEQPRNIAQIKSATQMSSFEMAEDASHVATDFITPTSSSGPIRVHYAPGSNSYAELSSTGLSIVASGVNVGNYTNSIARIGSEASYNTNITSSAVQIRDKTTVLASYGSTIKIGKDGDYTTIDSTGMNVFKDSIQVASFTNPVRIGNESLSHVIIDETGIEGVDTHDIESFRLQAGNTSGTSVWVDDYSNKQSLAASSLLQGAYYMKYTPISGSKVLIRGHLILDDNTYYKMPTCDFKYGTSSSSTLNDITVYYDGGRNISITPSSSKYTASYSRYRFVLHCRYKTKDSINRSYTFGTRISSYSTSVGSNSFAVGNDLTATGTLSMAFGDNLIASYANSFVIGKYNANNSDSNRPFVIGGGSSDTARNNIFYVDWNGGFRANGDSTCAANLNVLGNLTKGTDKYITQSTADGRYLTSHQSLSGYATQTWVNNQGFLTSHQSLSSYATKTWVNNQGFLTSHQSLSNYATKTYANTYASGETFSLSNGYLFGILITKYSAKFAINLPKCPSSNPSYTAITGQAVAVDGTALLGSNTTTKWNNSSALSISYSWAGGNQLILNISTSSSQLVSGVNDSTPLVFKIRSLSITF